MFGRPAAQCAPIRFEQCTTHQAARRLVSAPELNTAMLRCTNCSGCKECRRPVHLKVPEGTGGSRCSAEVAAKAEALHDAAVSKASSSRPGTSEAQQTYGADASGGMPPEPSNACPDAAAPANSALVDCAVCHRSQGTLVYLPPSSCVAGARSQGTAAQSARGRTGRWGTRLLASHTRKSWRLPGGLSS
jgi:hypothetical protein